jgi:hypothetical protein
MPPCGCSATTAPFPGRLSCIKPSRVRVAADSPLETRGRRTRGHQRAVQRRHNTHLSDPFRRVTVLVVDLAGSLPAEDLDDRSMQQSLGANPGRTQRALTSHHVAVVPPQRP